MATSQADWATTKVNAKFWNSNNPGTPAVQFTFVTRYQTNDSSDNGDIWVTPITASGQPPYGVIQEPAKHNDVCTVIVIGGTKVAISDTFPTGTNGLIGGHAVQCDNAGYAQNVVSGSGEYIVGVSDAYAPKSTSLLTPTIGSAVISCATPPIA